MKTEQIQQRIQDIRNELHSLDALRDGNDDVNIHIIETQIDALVTEKQNLIDLLDLSFDNLIGL